VAASFFSDWSSGTHNSVTFLDDGANRAASRAERAAAVAQPVSKALLAALERQNPERTRELSLLAEPGTVVVVTGQQMGLFLGPLFTLYKALSAVVNARALAAETGRPCVPIFWLQNEDHDLCEIDHTFVPTSSGAPMKVSLGFEGSAAWKAPVAHHVLGAGVTAAIDQLRSVLGREPHAAEHLAMLARAWTPGATMSSAFARAAAEVFAREGLVFLDPRDPAIAALNAPMHRRVLDEAPRLAELLHQRTAGLEAAGYGEQVHVRPGAPLAFFSPDAVDGARYRLEPAGADRFTLLGHPTKATVSKAELHAALERVPLRFTASALLRPLVQDALLPTAMYVGGPAEVAYFAQLAPLYPSLGLTMPLIAGRARLTVLDDRCRGLMEKLGLSAKEAVGPREPLLARLAAGSQHHPAPEAVEAKVMGALKPQLLELQQHLDALDPSLREPLQRTEESMRGALGKLLARYGKVLGQRDQVSVERLDRLRGYLVPNDTPQERVFGLAYYACRFGTRAFVDRVREGIKPFSSELKELSL
jgi:bacillithiol synthase